MLQYRLLVKSVIVTNLLGRAIRCLEVTMVVIVLQVVGYRQDAGILLPLGNTVVTRSLLTSAITFPTTKPDQVERILVLSLALSA